MNEEILGILPAKQATLIFTLNRLIIREKGILSRLGDFPFYYYTHGFFTGEAKDLQDAQKRVHEISQLSVENIMADKRSLALPYSDIVEISVEAGAYEEGLTFYAKIEGKEKKYKFNLMSDYLALEWQFLSTNLRGKVTFKQDYAGKKLEEVLNNSELYVLAEEYCNHLRSLGITANIQFVSQVNHVTAFIKLSDQNIDYIYRAPDYPFIYANPSAWFIVENVKGKLDKTKTNRKDKDEKLDFKWEGDYQLSNILNQDSMLKSSILQLMSQKMIKDIYIYDFKDKIREIYLKHQKNKVYEGKYVMYYSMPGTEYPRPRLPSKEYFDAMNKIAYHVRSLLS
jgi:hypothetical protein